MASDYDIAVKALNLRWFMHIVLRDVMEHQGTNEETKETILKLLSEQWDNTQSVMLKSIDKRLREG